MVASHPHPSVEPAEPCLDLNVGKIRIQVRSDLKELFEDFSALYRGCRSDVAQGSSDDADSKEPNTLITMHVKQGRRTRWGRKRYTVYADGEPMYTDRKRREALPYLEWGINWRLVSKCSAYLQLHAATVSRFGQGVLFAAHSGSGKSTLAAALLARGWQYFCDELSLVDPKTLMIQPFPKALCVKAGSFDLVERMGLPLWRRGHYVKAFKGPVGYINPTAVSSYTVAQPCPLRFVIFPRYRGNVRPRLEPISPAKAAFELAGHAMNRHHFGGGLVSLLSRAVRNARCFELETGRLDQTCALLESLVGQGGSDSSG